MSTVVRKQCGILVERAPCQLDIANGIFCSLNDGNRDLADSISIAIDRGGSAGLVWTDQGRVLHGPTHITYGCNTSQQTAYANANQGLSCKGPLGP